MNKLKNIIYNLIVFIIVIIFTIYFGYNIDKELLNKIEQKKQLYYKEKINAKIIGNKIISGKNGEELDIRKTYFKMLKYGNYNESCITTKKTIPTISISNNLDKYIQQGNPLNNNISFVFVITNEDELQPLINILEHENVTATFFIDTIVLEHEKKTIKKYSNFEYELLNNNKHEELYKTGILYLENITKKKPKYCLNKKEDNKQLKLCKSMNLYSVIPTLYINNNLYHEIINKISNSIIIELDINKKVISELSISINYIKKHGYNITTLDNLVKED